MKPLIEPNLPAQSKGDLHWFYIFLVKHYSDNTSSMNEMVIMWCFCQGIQFALKHMHLIVTLQHWFPMLNIRLLVALVWTHFLTFEAKKKSCVSQWSIVENNLQTVSCTRVQLFLPDSPSTNVNLLITVCVQHMAIYFSTLFTCIILPEEIGETGVNPLIWLGCDNPRSAYCSTASS